MKTQESDCVDCGLPCMGRSCPHYSVTRFYCDRCDCEGTLYRYDGEELCIDCLLENFEKIEGSDIYA